MAFFNNTLLLNSCDELSASVNSYGYLILTQIDAQTGEESNISFPKEYLPKIIQNLKNLGVEVGE